MDAVENGEVLQPPTPGPKSTAAVAEAPAVVAMDKEATVVDGVGNGDGANGGAGDKEDKKTEKEEKKEKARTVGTAKLLLKYATPLEMLYMFLGTIAAIVTG